MIDKNNSQLAHLVFFTLKNKSADSVQSLIDACNKYLRNQPGVVYFGVGTRDPELDRPVNDSEFDVALTVVFESRQSQDVYQQDPQHNQFIAEQKENWERVRVFDANVL
jgi:hypothetical protein